ncbi:MAG: LysE family translocator [Thermomicrobiales bacterium]|nr:LysE family translocator [Dehalococcoidia bacterium]MCA9864051.1 LysE family translocator [Thermomicrobiales bacterium]MCA9878420.1 LysE family translocator [Thermomicrobiales bacterium]
MRDLLDPAALVAPFLATLALVLVPGPAVLYIITRSVNQGRRAGLTSAAGIATGGLVHVAGATLGLSALLASSAVAFSLVKYLGAAYLIYLGLRTLLTAPALLQPATIERQRMRRLYTQGIVVQAFNPKVALFFLAFLPQFIDPHRGSAVVQSLILGTMFILVGLCTDSTYALVAGAFGAWLRQQRAFAAVQQYVAGSVFVGLGLTTAFTGHPSK